MRGLVIVMSLITIGKSRGQLSAVPGAINVRILSPLPLDPEAFVLSEQGRLVSITPQVLTQQNFVQPVEYTDRLEASDRNDGDLNLRPPTLRENRPDRRIFIPERVADRPRRPEAKIKTKNIEQNTNAPVNNRVDNNMNMDRQKPAEPNVTSSVNNKPNMTAKPETSTVVLEDPNKTLAETGSKVNESTVMDGATGKPPPPSVVDKATGVEVTLDERASFEGDKCPTGFVRVNDKCVEEDKDS